MLPSGYAARPDVQVLAVCDVRRERRKQARRRCLQIYADKFRQPNYRGVDTHADFQDLLARSDIDAVLLALPYHWAASMSILAMRAGKALYCEKPVAITVREAGLVLDTARQWGAVYQAGTQQRSEYSGRFRLACEVVRNSRIGTLREVYAYRLSGAFPPGPGPRWKNSLCRRDSMGIFGWAHCPGAPNPENPATPCRLVSWVTSTGGSTTMTSCSGAPA